jgi:dihydroneopterin aldolase
MTEILIQDLAVHLHIGVTEKEQRRSQKVLISLEIHPETMEKLDDALENTVDYSAVRHSILSLLSEKRFNLIETVAAESAEHVLHNFSVQEVAVTVKKFPYKDTAFVACRMSLAKPK